MIKILTVDDSRIYRSFILKAVEHIEGAEIIGTAYNGVKAMEFLNDPHQELPDVVTLDIEMPEMDGFQTLTAIQAFKKKHNVKIYVIMCSSLTQKGADESIKALRNGAFDIIAKPKTPDPNQSLNIIRNELSLKLKAYSASQVVKLGSKYSDSPEIKPALLRRQKKINIKYDAILIGISTGGPEALDKMLPKLVDITNLPILIVQHMPKGFIASLANHLDKGCSSAIFKAEHGQLVNYNEVYFSPGEQHMLLKNIDNKLHIHLTEQPKENGCRPSVDVLFRSAINSLKGRVIGVVLTGMGNDGTKGAVALKRAGAHIIVQDEESSVVWGMPGKVVEAGCVDKILHIDKIPNYIETLLQK